MPQPPLTVLILAGGSLGDKRLGPAPSLSDIPLDLADGSCLARQRSLAHYNDQTDPPRIALLRDSNQPSPRPHQMDAGFQLITIPPQPSVIGSVRAALPEITTPWLLLQPITSLPSQPAHPECWIELGEEALPREDWSAVAEPCSSSPHFLNKLESPSQDPGPSHPFTGLLCAPTELLRALIGRAPEQDSPDDQDLLNLAQRLWNSGQARFRFTPWRDLGHRATYSRSRLSRLSSRGFNRVSYCSQRDLIRKCSSDTRRLQEEAAYLDALPASARRFFPSLLQPPRPVPGEAISCLELDYVPFPNLAELFLHWRIGANGWRTIMRRLAQIRRDLAAHEAQNNEVSDVAWLYSSKLTSRQQQLQAHPPQLEPLLGLSWSHWWGSPLELQLLDRDAAPSGPPLQLPSPQTATARLTTALAPLETARPLQRIHGDLCFNNILAEPLSGSIRLIDPRGEQPTGAHWPIGYGDPRYDLVKLLHSGRYLYDVVVNGLFHLTHQQHQLRLQLDVPTHHREVNAAMQTELLGDQLSRDEERLLTASLFLSMLPLHREDPLRCVVLTCIGVLILEQRFDAVIEAGQP